MNSECIQIQRFGKVPSCSAIDQLGVSLIRLEQGHPSVDDTIFAGPGSCRVWGLNLMLQLLLALLSLALWRIWMPT